MIDDATFRDIKYRNYELLEWIQEFIKTNRAMDAEIWTKVLARNGRLMLEELERRKKRDLSKQADNL